MTIDTPPRTGRSGTIGSLVLIFPTEHEGGTLRLRCSSGELVFDSKKLIAEAKEAAADNKQSHIGYVASINGVRSEVATVTSGHLVSVTYNLYYDDVRHEVVTVTSGNLLSINLYCEEPVLDHVSMFPPIETNFRTVLESALNNNDFLPEGGYLGFGFCHEYPIETGSTHYYRDKIKIVTPLLKGKDAMILRVCKSLGLEAKIMFDFEENEEYEFLCDTDLNSIEADFDILENASLTEFMWRQRSNHWNTFVIKRKRQSTDFTVLWVTHRQNFNAIELPYIIANAWNVEPLLGLVYGKFCFLVKVGKSGKRKTMK